MKFLLSLLLLFFIFSTNPAQNNFTTGQSRSEFSAELEKKIDRALSDFLETGLTEKLDEAFWGSELLLRKSDNLFKTLSILFSDAKVLPEAQLRDALECAFTLYPKEFEKPLNAMVRKISHPKIFAMIAVYLSKSGAHLGFMLEITNEYIQRTGDHPIVQGLLHYLKNEPRLSKEEVSVLLKHRYTQNIIFSLHYRDRNKPGFVLMKKADGAFISDSSGEPVIIPQLARALSNMPGFLTNGNTPQGIFTILGTDTSENVFIGSTPNLQLALPFEVEPKLYFRSLQDTVTVMSRERYLSLLPEKLRKKGGFSEAFNAGKAGRNEIIAHGTATDINYYKNEIYFPYTPTLGCLCMREEWSEESGELLYSDQEKFMKLIFDNSITQGFLIVAEIDQAISPAEIKKLLK